MSDKNFLIMNENESEITLEEKVIEFIKNNFGELVLDKISIEIYTCVLDENSWTEGMNIKIQFNEFNYFNTVHGECIETIWLILEDKGLKPFYIDGEFKTLQVFEYFSGSPIQKTDIVYGINKDKLFDDFCDYILTC